MGRYGLHSGYGTFQNIQSGTADITADTNGDGTKAVTFSKSMKSTPIVVLSQQEADTTGTCNATSVGVNGFTAKIDGSSVTGDTVTVGWIAMDYSA